LGGVGVTLGVTLTLRDGISVTLKQTPKPKIKPLKNPEMKCHSGVGVHPVLV
jgi:hypothetical protein